MIPTDDPANERIFDCMAAIEYLCQYLSERFRDGTAYVAHQTIEGKGSGAYHRAQSLINELNIKQGGKYVHFGPGEAA
jgi:hypothetical protein